MANAQEARSPSLPQAAKGRSSFPATREADAYPAEFSIGRFPDSKYFRHIVGEHIEIRRYPDLASHGARFPGLRWAPVGDQSSHGLSRFGKDDLVAFLYHLNKRGSSALAWDILRTTTITC
jgi:hypothetical protein